MSLLVYEFLIWGVSRCVGPTVLMFFGRGVCLETCLFWAQGRWPANLSTPELNEMPVGEPYELISVSYKLS